MAAIQTQTISISLKLLSGEIIELEVSTPILTSQLYTSVLHALPQEIRPKHLYQIHLEKMDQEEKEHPLMEDPYPLQDQDILCVLLDPSIYRLTLDYIGPVYQTDVQPYRSYDKWRLMITRDTVDIFHSLVIYATRKGDPAGFCLYRQDMVNVLHRNHFREDETFQVPDHVMSLDLADLLAGLEVHDSLYTMFYNELQSEWNTWRQTSDAQFLREYIPELDDYADLD